MQWEAVDFACSKYFNGEENNRDVEKNWDMIASFIHKTVNKNIPMKEIKTQSLPWVTNKIRRLIRKRDKAHIKAKRTGNARFMAKWKRIQKLVKKEVKSAHDKHVEKY